MSGEPSHFELGVPDPERARRFYGEVLGWTFRVLGGGGAWIDTGGVVGGLHGDDDERTIELYFRVDDLDAAVERVRALGGEADDLGEPDATGRYVRARDDQGVRFGLHEPPR